MTLLFFLLILSVSIFVHELGHFLMAKKAGIWVEEFGFGLPPRIWGKKVGETLYSLNLLPFGGFVRLHGELGQEGADRPDRAYYRKPIWRRFSVLLAGVTMNLLLAVVCFSVLYFISGIPTPTDRVRIMGVAPGSPADQAELRAEDRIQAVNGQTLTASDQLVELARQNAGQPIELEVVRENQILLVNLVPRQDYPANEGPLGVAVTSMELKRYSWYLMPFLGVREGFRDSLAWAGLIIGSLKSMVVGLLTQGQLPKDIAGPVGIFQITDMAVKAGALAVLQFVGILSVNLAVLNILPLPALDGGRLVFLGYEALFRRQVSWQIESWANGLGMALLVGLMLLVTINDLLRLAGRV